MLHYKHLDITKYKEVLNKAQQFINTKIAKSLTEYDNGTKPISLSNLMSVILYCDYTDLSSDFSSTFRRLNIFETLKQIKKRNQKYANLSKILQNTITYCGQSYLFDNGFLSSLKGPFYCGMSIVLKMPQFQVYLLSPTSTSVHKEVATKFSGNKGMILEMDNDKGDSQLVMGMDCSWISRYREEDERYGFCCCYLLFFMSFSCLFYVYDKQFILRKTWRLLSYQFIVFARNRNTNKLPINYTSDYII